MTLEITSYKVMLPSISYIFLSHQTVFFAKIEKHGIVSTQKKIFGSTL